MFGGLAIAAVAGGSTWHQLLLTEEFHRKWKASLKPTDPLPAIPVFDARMCGPVGHAKARRSQMDALQEACLGPLTPAASGLIHLADLLARDWLSRCHSACYADLKEIAALAKRPGLYLLNSAYEWGCTTLAAPSNTGLSARLLRTLDWDFDGLGRYVELVRQEGEAGEYLNVTWPGAVGVLTAMAPGRFAASINYAPDRIIVQPSAISSVNGLLSTINTYLNVSDPPAAHVLRTVFEQARTFEEARTMLEQAAVAKPAIFTLVGLSPSETCVIERDRHQHKTRSGIASAANAWRYSSFPGNWQAVGGDADDPRGDNDERCALIETFAGKEVGEFEWVQEPILNGGTRLAVEADPGMAYIRVRGYEAGDDEDLVEPVTAILNYRA